MEINNYDEQPPGSYAIALFDIYFGPKWGMTFKRWKLCRSKKGNLYISGPNYKSGEFEGKATWSAYIDFNGEKGREFQSKVLELLKPFVNEASA